MIYLGTLGRMMPIKCPTQQQVAPAERYTFNTTLGGTVKAQAGPPGRRTWAIGLGQLTTPSDVGALMDFATGVWGSGPFWFVPADAPIVNLLTPDAASCHPDSLILRNGAELLGSPPLALGADGFAARSVWKNRDGIAAFGGPVPIVSGQLVTGSAWVAGAGTLRLIFVDQHGAEIVSTDSPAAGWSTPQRLSATARAPRTAAGVQLAITGLITQAARPAITWTPTAYEWGDGQGCDKAIIHNLSRDVTKAWDDPNTGRWSDVSFTVQEVG